jgi:hypothetical protein
MGDRANVGFKTSNGNTIFLYLHWGGQDRHEIVARAISYAMTRDDQESYFTRIFISRIVDTDWDKETGVGMAINELPSGGDGYDVPVYDYTNKVIFIHQEDWTEVGAGGLAHYVSDVYNRDEYLAKYAVRGVGAYVSQN